MKYKYLAIPLLVLLGVIGFGVIKNRTTTSTTQPITHSVTRETLISTISASGSLLSANYLPVTTSVTGLVKKVLVQEGDTVTVGQKIADLHLDPSSSKANSAAYASYLSAKSAVVTAETNLFTLQSALFAANQKLITDAVARDLSTTDPTYIQQNADWLAVEAKYKNQSQVVAEAKSNLQSSWLAYQSVSPILVSPVSGKISSLTIVPGLTLSAASTRVAMVAVPGLPLASFNVTEIDVPKIKYGQKATIKIDSLPDKTFTGKVVSVDRIGTVTSNVTNYPVIVQFDTEVADLLPNMSSTANIILEIKANALSLPTSAITTSNGTSTVKVLQDGRELITPVELGINSDTNTEITSGLSEGTVVIIGTTSSGAADTSTGTSVFGGGIRMGGFGR